MHEWENTTVPAGDFQRSKTHCPKGHEYSDDNTYVGKTGSRHCIACLRAHTQRLRQNPEYKQREAKKAREKKLANPSARRLLGELKRVKKEWLDSVKLKCSRCSEDDPVCLDFHHRDPSQKDENIGRMLNKAWSLPRLQAEVAKCDVLCSNCHRKLHWSLRNRQGG